MKMQRRKCSPVPSRTRNFPESFRPFLPRLSETIGRSQSSAAVQTIGETVPLFEELNEATTIEATLMYNAARSHTSATGRGI